jgi:hypothetical protein
MVLSIANYFRRVLEYPVEWIEQQLAHKVRDMHGTAYNHTKHLESVVQCCRLGQIIVRILNLIQLNKLVLIF